MKQLPLFLILLLFIGTPLFGDSPTYGKIEGSIQLDSTWSTHVYLSYISAFSEMHSMSNEMIIAETNIGELGNFEFDLDFLPEEDRLYRLHISKKEDSKTSLIIGGQNENFLLFIANRKSKINFKTSSKNPPFRKVDFYNHPENATFQNITDLVFTTDSIASISKAAKRKFIGENLNTTLLQIADTSSNALISLYALHKSDFETNFLSNASYQKTYLNKWSGQENPYLKSIKNSLPTEAKGKSWLGNLLIYLLILIAGVAIGKYGSLKTNRIKKLSVQERKIYKLLQDGASNKEISDEFNIGLSTAKSHVSSILGKLNVKSRKDIMNMK